MPGATSSASGMRPRLRAVSEARRRPPPPCCAALSLAREMSDGGREAVSGGVGVGE
jgi:hypothetical protein